MLVDKLKLVTVLSVAIVSQVMAGPALADPMQPYYECVNSAYAFKDAEMANCADYSSNTDLRQMCERWVYQEFESWVWGCMDLFDPPS